MSAGFPTRVESSKVSDEVFGPCVCVFTSENANSSCAKNNLSFCGLLEPFSNVVLNTRCRDGNGREYNLDALNIRFLEKSSLLPLTEAQVNSELALRVVRDTESVSLDNIPLVRDQKDIEEYLLRSECTPWFNSFRSSLFDLVRGKGHETFHQPLACMLVASTADEDPVKTLTQLYDIHNPGAPLDYIYMDRDFTVFYVLLHDVSTHSDIELSEKFSQVQAAFSNSHCLILQINSKSQEDEGVASKGVPPDMFKHILVQRAMETVEEKRRRASATKFGRRTTLTPDLCPLSSGSEDEGIARNADENESVVTGAMLANADLDRIHAFVRAVAGQVIVPHLQSRVDQLSEQLAHLRRGLTRSFISSTRKWFGGGEPKKVNEPKLVNPTGYGPQGYSQDGSEQKMRRLGDLAFIMKDYELAFHTYSAARRDYHNDKAIMYHAGAQEMIGLCIHKMDPKRRDCDSYFEQAAEMYAKKCKDFLYAERSTLLLADILISRQSYRDAASKFIVMTGEESDLRSAMLLEQAAHCFLRHPDHAMYRKYSFHLILAGHRYSKSNQRLHALVCYYQALKVYEGKRWSLAEDHIYFTIGRQSFYLSDLEKAMISFSKLLREDKVPSEQESSYLREFLYTIKQYLNEKKDYVPTFPLPSVDHNNIRVTLYTELKTNLPDHDWVHMEKTIKERYATEAEKQRWGFPVFKPSLPVLTKDSDNTIQPKVVINEPIEVEVSLFNHLQIPINLQNVRLVCEYRPTNDLSSSTSIHINKVSASRSSSVSPSSPISIPLPTNSSTPNNDNNNDNNNNESSRNRNSDDVKDTTNPLEPNHNLSDFVFSADKGVAFNSIPLDSLIIEARKTVPVKFCVVPLKKGRLIVKGIEFSVDDAVHGTLPFILKGKLLRKTKKQVIAKMRSPDLRLDFQVSEFMPNIEITMSPPPATTLIGSVSKMTIQIKNTGTQSLKSLCAITSHPYRVCFGLNEKVMTLSTGEEQKFTKKKESHSPSDVIFSNLAADKGIFDFFGFDDSEELPPGAILTFPLWLRSDTLGFQELNMLFSYKTTNANSEMPSRYKRFGFATTVLPSLKVSVQTIPNRKAVQEIILAIDIEALQLNLFFTVLQLSLYSEDWEIHPLNTTTVNGNGQVLGPLEICSSFVRLVPKTKAKNAVTEAPFYSHNDLSTSLASDTVSSYGVPLNGIKSCTDAPVHDFCQKIISSALYYSGEYCPPSQQQYQDQQHLILQKQHQEHLQLQKQLPQFLKTNSNSNNHTASPTTSAANGLNLSSNNLLTSETPFLSSSPSALFPRSPSVLSQMSTMSSLPGSPLSQRLALMSDKKDTSKEDENLHLDKTTLIVFYETKLQNISNQSETLCGQLHVPCLKLSPHSSVMEAPMDICTLSPNSPIKFLLHHPDRFVHDFKQKRLCIVPVTLVVFNATDQDIDISIELNPPTPSLSHLNAYGQVTSTSQFSWFGKTSFQFEGFQPQEEQKVEIQAIMTSQGVYDLNRYKVSCKLCNRKLVFRPVDQHLVTICDE